MRGVVLTFITVRGDCAHHGGSRQLERFGRCDVDQISRARSHLFPEETDLELRVTRFERLMNRRPELLSSVVLRQNPHNVDEWLKRALLFETNPAKVNLDIFFFPFSPRYVWFFGRFTLFNQFSDHHDLRASSAGCGSQAGDRTPASALDCLRQVLRE